jgi:hypothetical protein
MTKIGTGSHLVHSKSLETLDTFLAYWKASTEEITCITHASNGKKLNEYLESRRGTLTLNIGQCS